MSINRGMDKEVGHIYKGILFSYLKKNNEIMSFAATLIDLEIIILGKVSQKEKYMISLTKQK